MSKESLIHDYKKRKFEIEEKINREEDSLERYQIRKDNDAIMDCRERLTRLYSSLKDFDDKIKSLESSRDISANSLVKSSAGLPKLDNNNIPIDNGEAKLTTTLTKEIKGTKGHGAEKMDIHTIHTKTVKQSLKIKNGEVISETTIEYDKKQTKKTKSNTIDIKSKLVK